MGIRNSHGHNVSSSNLQPSKENDKRNRINQTHQHPFFSLFSQILEAIT
jgi:hypothetical protein